MTFRCICGGTSCPTITVFVTITTIMPNTTTTTIIVIIIIIVVVIIIMTVVSRFPELRPRGPFRSQYTNPEVVPPVDNSQQPTEPGPIHSMNMYQLNFIAIGFTHNWLCFKSFQNILVHLLSNSLSLVVSLKNSISANVTLRFILFH